MKSRSSDRCGWPSFWPPFSLRSGGSMLPRDLSMPSLYQDGLLLGCPGRVIVYRDGSQRVSTGRELARVGAITDPLTRLIDVGELEAAVVDAEFPERDGITPRSTMFRRATLAAAQTWLGLPAAPAAIDPTGLPETVSLRVSEGYAYYSLDPRSYAAAARRLHDETAVPRCSVIGIRSIGTSLSAVVAAVLAERGCETRTHTVRPRGHPFDRRLALDESLISAWRRDAVDGAFFAVVDEGPGISGSSFAAVVTALDSL